MNFTVVRHPGEGEGGWDVWRKSGDKRKQSKRNFHNFSIPIVTKRVWNSGSVEDGRRGVIDGRGWDVDPARRSKESLCRCPTRYIYIYDIIHITHMHMHTLSKSVPPDPLAPRITAAGPFFSNPTALVKAR